MLHEHVPRDRLANLQYRQKLTDACARDKGLRRDVLAACKRDILYYVNAFVFTYDPRRRKIYPFCTWPFQDKAFVELADAVRDGMEERPLFKDTVIEKSRDMGASWMCLTVFDYFFKFWSNCNFLMISRTEELVDAKENPKSLFWKLDFINAHLPAWFAPDLVRTKLHYGNPRNGSTIDGEATTGAGGVGDRRTAILVDELSRIPLAQQRELVAGTADTTECRLFNFTPFGTAGAAYELTQRKNVRKLWLHWSMHPVKGAGLYQWDKEKEEIAFLDKSYQHPVMYEFVKDGKLRSPWYDQQCQSRSKQEVAMMLDIDYQGSSYQFFDSDTIDDLKDEYALPPRVQGELDYFPDTYEFKSLVKTANGTLRLWLNLDKDGRPPFDRAYVFGADVAAGSGASNSCLSGWDCKTGEKILELASPHLLPQDFAARTLAVLHWFSPPGGEGPKIAWEMEGPGTIFGQELTAKGYRHVYMRRNELSYSKKVTDTPGWVPTDSNKLSLLAVYRLELTKHRIINRSVEALDELKAFVVVPPGKIEHSSTLDTADPTGARKNHGDRGIADALAVKLYLERRSNPQQKDVDVVLPNSLAGRRERSEELRRERKDIWG
jgi:hypothetical protein